MSTVPPTGKAEQLARLKELGEIKPGCRGCEPFYRAENPLDVLAPRHRASSRCQSGSRPHCTCDTCF